MAGAAPAAVLRIAGPFPDAVPLAPETLETVQSDGYRQETIVFDSEDTMSVPAYLLVPDARTEPGPAVLAIHGHGPGKSHVCGLAETAQPNADYARQLVRRGYVVLAPDLRCFGERVDEGPGGPLRVRHEPRPRLHGRLGAAHSEPVGYGARPRPAGTATLS